MTTPATGAIKFSEINTELGLASTTQISMSSILSRNLAGVPSGAIKFSDYYNKSLFVAPGIAYSSDNISGKYKSMAVDAANNIYITGTYSGASFFSNWFTVKLNSARVIQLQRHYGNQQQIYSSKIKLDTAGNIYEFGESRGQPTTTSQGWNFVKYNAAGALQWQRRYGNAVSPGAYPYYDIDLDVVPATGTLVSVGDAAVFGGLPTYMMCYNSAGALAFVRTIFFTALSSGASGGVAVDASGNIFWGGQIDNNVAPRTKGFLLKYDSAGTLQWQMAYQNANSFVIAVETDAAGNVYTITKNTAGQSVLTKFNTSGVVQWQRIICATSGFIAVEKTTGSIFFGSSANANGFVAKYNTSGVLQWQRSVFITATTLMTILDVAMDTSGNCYVLNRNGFVKISSNGSGIGTYGTYKITAATQSESVDLITWAILTGCTYGTGSYTSVAPTDTDVAGSAGAFTVVS